jgi:hypothetical protein
MYRSKKKIRPDSGEKGAANIRKQRYEGYERNQIMKKTAKETCRPFH